MPARARLKHRNGRRRTGPVRALVITGALLLAAVSWLALSRRSALAVAPARSADLAHPPEFGPTVVNTGAPPVAAPQGMAWIPGGEFSMGANDPPDKDEVGMKATRDARPVHRVYVDGFFMDRTDVTNRQFAAFVRATGYTTVAERVPRASDFPGAPPENLVAGSVVFSPPGHPVALDTQFRWWSYVPGADWRHPLGPGSDLTGKDDYPVVHVAYADAEAYAKWAGKRLPTEAEWEFAARSGLAGRPFVWGDSFRPAEKWMANTHQGHFPDTDTAEDGHAGIAPVAQYAPNGYGLYDMAGNVWQWTSDWYDADYYRKLAEAGAVAHNPSGPNSSWDPAEPGQPKKAQRGGSFLCTDQYCSRYIVGTRGKGEVSTGTNHLGFRCVMDPSKCFRSSSPPRPASSALPPWTPGEESGSSRTWTSSSWTWTTCSRRSTCTVSTSCRSGTRSS